MSAWLQISATATGALALAALIRGAWRVNKRLVMISNAVAQLVPNGGESIKDAVTDIRRDVRSIDKRVGQLERRRGWLPWP